MQGENDISVWKQCLWCEISQFGNLNYIGTNLKGGELHVLEETISQKKVFPCELSLPLDCCFKIWEAAQQSLDDEEISEDSLIQNDANLRIDENYVVPLIEMKDIVTTPLLLFLYPCFSDLKASLFLALTGHYRSAIQLLRPVIENVVVGQFQEEKIRKASKKKNFLKKIDKEYDKFFEWMSGDRELNFNSSMQYLTEEEKILTDSEEKQLMIIWRKLNKYLHPYPNKWPNSNDPATTYYDKHLLNRWIYFYEETLAYIMEIIYRYYPWIKDNMMAIDSLNELNGWYSTEAEFNRSIVKSRTLKTFIFTR